MSTEERESTGRRSWRGWRAMADRLAERLANHAMCLEHPTRAPDGQCPFCQDRAAYCAYLEAGGTDWRLV